MSSLTKRACLKPETVFLILQVTIGLFMGAHSTIYVPFLVQIGLSVSQVFLVNVFYAGAIMVAEVPTGMLADTRGRRWSVQMGMVAWMLSGVMYVWVSGFWSAVIAEVVGGIGQAFISGSLNAWITDALHMRDNQVERKRVFGNGEAIKRVFLLLGGAFGALLGGWTLRAPFAVSAACAVPGIILGLWYMTPDGEAHNVQDRVAEDVQDPQGFAAFTAQWKDAWCVLNQRDMRWIMLFMVSAIWFAPINFFWPIWFKTCTGVRGLGLVWIVMMMGLLVGSKLVSTLKHAEASHERRHLLLAIVASAVFVPILVLAGCGVWGIAVFFLHEIGRGAITPLQSAYIQGRAQKRNGATVESSVSLLVNGCGMLVLVALGTATQGVQLSMPIIATLWICGSTLVLLCVFALWLWRKLSP
ncbi:MAG: MFS transporter [Patescibacteria group bacterium]